jgi:hypothetical protein
MIIRLFLIILLLTPIGLAQIPGDFNCSGAVNGFDYVELINRYRMGPMDTGTCVWYNGDLNGDSVFHTVADWRQLYRLLNGDINEFNPPMPFNLDTISVGSATAIAGETVSLPIYIASPERIFDSMIHLQFDTTWLDSWRIVMANHGAVGTFSDGDYYWWGIFDSSGFQPGSYLVGDLILGISPDCPVGTEIPLILIAGNYYPCGFANDSYPTYFIRPILVSGVVSVNPMGIDGDEIPLLPRGYLTAYPNPFNSSVKIKMMNSDLTTDQTISIFDIAGRRVRTITMPKQAGEVVWNGRDDNGERVSSGVYFAKIADSDKVLTAKLTLLK